MTLARKRPWSGSFSSPMGSKKTEPSSSIYPLHPPGSQILVRIPESDVSLLDRVIVASSSVIFCGSFLWMPLFCYWIYRRWLSVPKGDKRRRAVYATIILACFGIAAVGPHRHPRVGKWLQVRRWKLWDAWLKFIAMEILVDLPEQSPNNIDVRNDQVLFAFVPHGTFPFAFGLGVVPEIAQKAFGYFQPIVATATELLPIVRDILKWMNRVDASRESVDQALSEGRRLGVVPGGIAEMFEGYPKPNTTPDEEYAIVRKGFIRMAVKHGVPVIPVYCFGSTKLFRRLQSSWLERFSVMFKIAICIFYGKWGLPIPFRQRLMYVMGQPMMPSSANTASGRSQEEQVEELYQRFCKELIRLFERHKESYGWGSKTLKLIAR